MSDELPFPAPHRGPVEARAELERAREATAQSIERLGRELAERFNWRIVVGREPVAWLGAAFLAGLWIGWQS